MRSQDPGTVWIKWQENKWLCESWCPVIVQSRDLELENVRNFLQFMQLISVGMGGERWVSSVAFWDKAKVPTQTVSLVHALQLSPEILCPPWEQSRYVKLHTGGLVNFFLVFNLLIAVMANSEILLSGWIMHLRLANAKVKRIYCTMLFSQCHWKIMLDFFFFLRKKRKQNVIW